MMHASLDGKLIKAPEPLRILPPNWFQDKAPVFYQLFYAKRIRGRDLIHVIISEEKHQDDNWWLHVSLSYHNGIPNYDTIIEVKDIFIGVEKKAIMVFPKKSEWVNFHPGVLHLYSPLDFDPLPDFRIEGNL